VGLAERKLDFLQRVRQRTLISILIFFISSSKKQTGQLASDARAQGFDNVHDYLIHVVTKEDAETIKSRF
jgi:hypothetical protein